MIDLQSVARLRTTRTITVLDHVRIFNMLRRETNRGAAHIAIFDLIDSAELVSPQDIAPDVVTMLSRVAVVSCGSAERSEVTLCYPEDADPQQGRISILTPLGAALLGLRAGDVAQWTTRDGTRHSARILEILMQPEARGNFIA